MQSAMKHETTEQILDHVFSRYGELSPKLRQAAQYVLDNPNEIGVSSMRQVAAAAAVMPNTLVRMARALCFDSYEAFRDPFREVLRRGVENFPDRVRWLQSIGHGNRHAQLLAQMAAAGIANIESLYSGTNPDELKAVADLIIAAPTAYVLGSGSCYSLAHNFAYVAGMALDNVVMVPRHGSPPVDDIARCGAGDAVIAMSFRPYRREVVEAARLGNRCGATLISITDSRTSPLAFGAEHVLTAPTNTPQFFPSVLSTMALLETLLAFVVAESNRKVVSSISAFHRLREQSGVYWSDD